MIREELGNARITQCVFIVVKASKQALRRSAISKERHRGPLKLCTIATAMYGSCVDDSYGSITPTTNNHHPPPPPQPITKSHPNQSFQPIPRECQSQGSKEPKEGVGFSLPS